MKQLLQQDFWPVTFYIAAQIFIYIIFILLFFSLEREIKDYNKNMDYFRGVLSKRISKHKDKKVSESERKPWLEDEEWD